ncbi:hypothetical protein SAMN06265348_10626 [Pedobacter westerhofensis]|uniref:AAA domain-containing protein n=1 Tax=Pedobacter westerhofensis TaxID=425512 RepID=A0A521DNH9_9SPHI|nr:hypothetical protein [Pedobacter westerhofensis]SMO73178.1 hypothetical protein SAMN06265348_10626 [Pedobacter westerhofensis]
MDNQGFYIKQISFRGPDGVQSGLPFEKGLNIVAGSSDTGKSFILDSIDYMMGGGKELEKIGQLEKYDQVLMEIRTFESDIAYTIRRDLSLGAFYIKIGSIDQAGDEIKYAAKSSDKNDRNISSFLLGLIGLNSVRLTSSDATKATRKLSYRDVAHVTMIDEVKMFSKESPLLSGNPATKRAERSFFEYLISQKDSSHQIKVEKEEIRKTRLNAQIDYVKARLKADRERLITIENSLDQSRSLKLDDLSSINEKYALYFKQLETNKLERKKIIDERTEIESEILYNNQLLDRFSLLLSHYDADLERLQFIDEGNTLFSQLNYVACPVCGTDIEEQHYKCIQNSELQTETLNEAIESEYQKIREKTLDLKQTVAEIEDRNQIYRKELTTNLARISELDQLIDQEIIPVISGLKSKIESIVGQELLSKEKERIYSDIEALDKDLKELEEEKKKKRVTESAEPLDALRLKKFEVEVKHLLQSWKFDKVSEVNFDPAKSDIRIDGKNRSSYGKGYRAIGQSAFIIGLMHFLRQNESKFSKLLVLDSPLTAYKKEDQPPSNEQQITKELESEFFRGLIDISRSCQIIILENKEPPAEVVERSNYVHFSRNSDIGRAGLL